MATIQGTIRITDYLARIEQAMTEPARTPSRVLSMNGVVETGDISHALMYFESPGSPKYGEGSVSPGFRCRVFLDYEDFPVCLDLVRNEKPVYFHYSYQSSKSNHPRLKYYSLSTSAEPVGEGES